MMPTTLATRSRNESNEKAISLSRGRRRRYMSGLLRVSLARQHRPLLDVNRIQQWVSQVEGAQAVLVDQEANDDLHGWFVRPLGGTTVGNQVVRRPDQQGVSAPTGRKLVERERQ